MDEGKAISIEGLVKHYGQVPAVRGITFSIDKGEFFGLLGPNGAGKSTTINSITGLCIPTAGRVTVFGHDVTKEYRITRRIIGLSPQEGNLDRYFSIRQILAFQGGYFGLQRKEAETRADELLDFFGLADKRNQIYIKLSGGMKRRVLIAKAMVHKPSILILDEPTAGVDVELRKILWEHLRELNRNGTTILLTTHYIEEAEELCQRVAIINEGKVIALDNPRNLIEGLSEGFMTIKLQAPLNELPTEEGVETADGGRTLIVRGRDRSRLTNQLLKFLADKGIEISDIDVRRNNLEDVFVRLTGRRLH